MHRFMPKVGKLDAIRQTKDQKLNILLHSSSHSLLSFLSFTLLSISFRKEFKIPSMSNFSQFFSLSPLQSFSFQPYHSKISPFFHFPLFFITIFPVSIQFIIYMGNKTIQGLSSVITKNWLPLYEGADVYQNKLTSQTVREQFIKIEKTNNFQELKFRMKEKNPYICRVVFYSHYIHSLYYVFTQQNRNKPVVKNFREWEIHQKNIIESFISLAARYGPTRVCREMIGVDNSGQIKIWINPNTVKSERWLACESVEQMVQDIKYVLEQIVQDSSPTKTRGIKMKNVQSIKINQDQNNCVKKGYNKNLELKKLSQLKLPAMQADSKSEKRLQFLRPSFTKCNRKGARGKTNLKKSDNNTSTSEHEKQKQKRDRSKHTQNMFLDLQHSNSNSHFFPPNDPLNRARTEFFPQFKTQETQVYTSKTQKVKNPGHYRTHSLAQNKIGMGHMVSQRQSRRQKQTVKGEQIWGSQRLDKNRIFTDFHFQRKSFEGDQKVMSKKLQDVKHIIVIQEGQSYFNSRERKRQRCALNEKQNEENILSRNQLTLSQEFFVFFHDNDSSQIHRVRKTSRLFQNLLQEVNDLLD